MPADQTWADQAAKWPEPFMEHRLYSRVRVMLVAEDGTIDDYHWEELN